MKDNGLLVQYFNANTPADQTLWAKAAKDAATLKKLGATAVWFPPATKGAAGKDDRGYAPYDLYDLGEFNQKGSVGTRYGTKKEYLEAIDAMKAQGINVYADIAVRQKLGADSVEKVTAADFNAKDIPQMVGMCNDSRSVKSKYKSSCCQIEDQHYYKKTCNNCKKIKVLH